MSFLGDIVASTGNKWNLPEFGLSENLGSTGRVPTTQQNVANQLVSPTINPFNAPMWANDDLFGEVERAGESAANQSAQLSGGGSGGSGMDLSYLDDQAQQLRDLLARTDTGLNQGLTQNEDEYQRQLGGANASKEQQYANYADQRVDQNKGKLKTYDTINKNANNGYRSLAQIIGRAAGTGSSAYRDLLPNVIGTDTSSKRADANETFGSNLRGIDKAQGQFDISFADVLDDLMRQKKTNESALRSGIESQRQGINSQLGTVAGQRAQALGGGYNQVRAAQQPFQDSINNSRNQVESFFNTFRTAYTPKAAVAATPELGQYTADRSVINAQNQGASDATNPYAALLRKRLTGQA